MRRATNKKSRMMRAPNKKNEMGREKNKKYRTGKEKRTVEISDCVFMTIGPLADRNERRCLSHEGSGTHRAKTVS